MGAAAISFCVTPWRNLIASRDVVVPHSPFAVFFLLLSLPLALNCVGGPVSKGRSDLAFGVQRQLVLTSEEKDVKKIRKTDELPCEHRP